MKTVYTPVPMELPPGHEAGSKEASVDGFAPLACADHNDRDGVRIVAKQQQTKINVNGHVVIDIVSPAVAGADVGIVLQKHQLMPMAITGAAAFNTDTALAMREGGIVVEFFANECWERLGVAEGNSAFIPAGTVFRFLNPDAMLPATCFTARAAGEEEGRPKQGHGVGSVTVVKRSQQRVEYGHGIARRWLVSEDIVGHPIGVGLVYGEVPAFSAGHFHAHPGVATGITIQGGAVSVPFYDQDEPEPESAMKTAKAFTGDGIFIRGGTVHGPTNPFGSAMIYFAARAGSGLQD